MWNGVYKMTDQEMWDLFDKLLAELGHVPTMAECESAGAIGDTARISILRRLWATERGVADQIKRGGKRRTKPNPSGDTIEERARAVRLEKMPERKEKRQQRTPIEKAMGAYRKSWKRIREVLA